MRDPERIDRICALLAEAWKRTPDQRLGQLIVNLSSDMGDPFYIEDEAYQHEATHARPATWTERLVERRDA